MIDIKKISEGIDTPWGEIGYIVFKRTYARKLKESDPNSKTEEFWQIVERELEASDSQLKVGFTEEEKVRYAETRLQLKWSVAGRFMWQLGTKTVRNLGLPSLQNCAGVVVDSPIRPFTWTFEMLMLGSGVGYNIQREHVNKLPKLKNKIKIVRQDDESADFIVPDTREGWVKLLGKVLKAHFYGGQGFSYSTQLIRSKGAVIKGFGGLASGPEELCWGIEEISKILNSRSFKKLRPIDCLDIMNIIGFIVVSGNVRRSAQLAIGDYDDIEYLKAKRWDLGTCPPWRGMSNNSVAAPEDLDLLPKEFWETYNQGEPYGLINLELSRSCGRVGDTRYTDKDIFVYNPCITGDTLVAVADGRNAVPIKDLVDTVYPVYSIEKGKTVIKKSLKTWKTRENAEIWKLTLDDGSTLRATPDHLIMLRNGTYKALKDLSEGESLMPFDSYISNKSYRQISSNIGRDRRQYRMIAEYNDLIVDPKTTAIHHRDFNSFNDCIDNLESMSHEDHRLLHSERMKGDDNPVRKMSEEEYRKTYVNFYTNDGANNPMFNRKHSKETLEKIGKKSKENWEKQRELMTERIREGVAARYNHKVVSVEFIGYEDVYDMTVEDTHNFGIITSTRDDNFITSSGIFIHNCAEQSLNNYETCCLGMIYLPNIDTYEELLECLTYCYRMCKHSLALHCSLKETEAIVNANMRMGIGVPGYLSATEEQRSWLSDAYEWLRKYDEEYSKAKGFPKSIKLTTSKPDGTNALIPRVKKTGDVISPGANVNPAGPYYIRRVTIASNSPLLQVCINNGYRVEPKLNFDGTIDRNSFVVEFPCKTSLDTPVAANTDWKFQIDVIRRVQREWSDNSVSCTITYRKEDIEDIKAYLKEHFTKEIKTVSFLLYSDHGFKQAPYEDITEEQYWEYKNSTTPITSLGYINEDSLEELGGCESGSCPIK